ncbi:hypothetical protein fugu_005262 [Takifugu bimaculatus]|uniref:Extended synaptotagmin-like protein 1b n=1 Tax=Takifugu bimaculatus TaxID=433685 RepID=A0A4Z2BBH9_9TELE|nr:hypothetical protein fugu_005262 [Takifugu bimaculatus]
MMVYTGWKHAREAKEARLKSAIEFLDDEDECTSRQMSRIKRELPAWVNFPDVEKVEWLNKVLQQVWPFVGQYLEKLLMETIAPSIRASSTHLQTFGFTKVDMGDKAMKVVGIKAHTENDKGQVLLDLYISYVGNVEINVEVKRYFCKAGVKEYRCVEARRLPDHLRASSSHERSILFCLQLHGMMRVILEPLIGDVPIAGAVSMFFIKRPRLDINWTGLTNLLDIPGLNVMSDSMIMDAIASCLVLPNRLVVPLVQGLHVAQLRSPLPRVPPAIPVLWYILTPCSSKYIESFLVQGVVRIYLLEAQNLEAKDSYVKGVMAGLSDPYAITRVGPQHFTSKHMDNTDSPKWNETYEWFALKDTESGRVHFRLEWLSLLPSTERLEQVRRTQHTFLNRPARSHSNISVVLIQVLKRNESITSNAGDPPSSAILVVYLDKAEELPVSHTSTRQPNPIVHLSVQDTKRESKICYTTTSPEWEEAFTFFIQDPRKQDIDIQVKDADRVQALGSLTIPLSRLLSTPDLSLDQWFQLDKAGSASRIYIKAVLRVILTQLPGQELHLEVFDYDMDMKDDFMGRLKIGLKDIIDSQYTDQWFSLNDVKSGRVHLTLEWVPTASEAQSLDQVLQFHSRQSFQNKAVPSAALLFVLVEQANGLPLKKSGKEPKVGAEVTLGKLSQKTTVSDRTTSPQWNEAFCFLVQDPKEDILVVKLSHSWALPIGSLVVPVKQLLSEPELILDQWLNLDGASPESQILLRAELKTVEEVPTPAVVQPPHTSPKPSFAGEVVLKPESEQEQVKVELFDKDMDKDDFLGRVNISVGDIINSQYTDQWYTLNDVKSGRVRLIMEWVQTVSHGATLDQVMQMQSHQSYHNKTVPAAALLFVLVDRANLLPLKKSGKEPKAGAELVCGNATFKTKVCDRSRSPQWSEAFYFVVHDPRQEMLIVKLSSAWDQPMGSLVLPVRQLLSQPQLVLDEWMPLDGALPDSKILLRAELKILNSMMIEAPQPAVTASKEEEVLFSTDHTFKTPSEDKSELPSQEAAEDDATDDYTPAEPAGTHLVPSAPAAPAPLLEEIKPADEYPAQTEAGREEDLEEMTEDADMGDLAHATVMGLPAETVGPAEVPDVRAAGEVLPQHTAPGLEFGKELVLRGNRDHEIKFEAYDKDLDNDDFLGRFSVRLNEVIRSQYTDQWYTLNDVKSGKVHLILEWVPAVSHPVRLDEVLQLQSLQSFQNKAVPAAALLFIHLEGAHSLPLKKSGKEPKAGAELVLGETTYKTQLCDRSTSPQWNESFYFLVHDPKLQMLIVKLSSGWDQPMGSLVLPVKNLLAAPQLVMDQWFHLDGALPESQVLLRAELKILDSKMLDLISAGTLPCAAPIWGSMNGQVKLTLSYSSLERQLMVVVHACRGLLPQSKDAVDSYVSLMLLPDKNKATKKKTAVKKRDQNPEYNERFEYDLPLDELRFRRLSVTVKNNSASFRSRDVIGQVQIELAQINLVAGVTDWFTLRDDAE